MPPRSDELLTEWRAETRERQRDHENRLRILEETVAEGRVKMAAITFVFGSVGAGMVEFVMRHFIK